MSLVTPMGATNNGGGNNNNNRARRGRATPSRRRATIICGGEDITDILNGGPSFTPSRRVSIAPGSFKRPREESVVGADNLLDDNCNDAAEPVITDSESTGGTPIPVKMAREEAMFNEEEEDLRLSVYKEMEISLTRKIKAQRDEAIRLKQVDKDGALEALRKGKALRDQLKMLIAAKNHPSKPYPPEYRRVKRTVKRLIKFPKIPENSLQVVVNSVDGLSLNGASILNTYVYSEFKFSDGLPQTIIRSPPVSGTSNPTYNYTTYIPIERKKSYIKFFERKKIVFCVYQKRPFFLPDVLLAKFDVPLAGLIRNAENEIICPLYQQKVKRSDQDATASVTVRLQVPLIGDDIRTVEVEDIEITGEIFVPKDDDVKNVGDNDEKNEDGESCNVKKRLDSFDDDMGVKNDEQNNENALNSENVNDNNSNSNLGDNVNNDVVVDNETSETQETVQLSTSSELNGFNETKKEEGGKEEQADNVETLRNEAIDIKRYNSAELSDMEIKRIDDEIKRFEVMNKEVPPELNIRRKLIENQSTILMVLVQKEKLTMEQYIKQLCDMVAADEALLEKLRLVPELKNEMDMTVSRIETLKKEIQSGQE